VSALLGCLRAITATCRLPIECDSDGNEISMHHLDIKISEPGSKSEHIIKHISFEHDLLLRHTLPISDDDLFQSIECLFLRSRRFCRLPAREFDIPLVHPLQSPFVLTSVMIDFFPIRYMIHQVLLLITTPSLMLCYAVLTTLLYAFQSEQTYPRPSKVQVFVIDENNLQPIAEVACEESPDKTVIRFPDVVIATKLQISML
jgi:hypothetical protein